MSTQALHDVVELKDHAVFPIIRRAVFGLHVIVVSAGGSALGGVIRPACFSRMVENDTGDEAIEFQFVGISYLSRVLFISPIRCCRVDLPIRELY